MENPDLNQMPERQQAAFVRLFKEACAKCFGRSLVEPLTETESKFLATRIFEATGLVIGVKSVKNYAAYVLHPTETKKENPSVATLDTLARYVLNAPYTDESKRKDTEGHFPYWFDYKSRYNLSAPSISAKRKPTRKMIKAVIALSAMLLLGFGLLKWPSRRPSEKITEHFNTVREDSLTRKGWFVKHKENAWWRKRGASPGYLQLFTLTGDNWPDAVHTPRIKNLLVREIKADCFAVEVHLRDFIPRQNWQQAGILLLEDTTELARSIRLSVGYNDYFGGYAKPAQIHLQAISLNETSSQPEEMAQIPLFTLEAAQQPLVRQNLYKSALRIEKRANQFRFLFATTPLNSFAFKEATTRELNIVPRFVGIFALQGFVNNTDYLPVNVDYFSLDPIICSE